MFRNLFLLGISLVQTVAFAQYTYLVGKGEASIEPDAGILSVALAGYGAPREGRFSLEWEERGDMGTVTDAVIYGEALYALREGGLFQTDLSEPFPGWQLIRQDEQISALAAAGKYLYGINEAGDVFRSAIPNRRSVVGWKQLGTVPAAPQSLCYWNDMLVLLDKEGKVWTTGLQHGRLSWEVFSHCPGAIDLAADAAHLYALTHDQEICAFQGDGGWLRIAIHNGITYNQELSLLLASKNGFWSIDRAGRRYLAQHSSTHQLTVGAMAIQNESDRVLVISADLCGFAADFIDAVKSDIEQKYGIPPAAVMVNASHTHFAPITQRWPTWIAHCQKPDSAYLNTVVKTGMLRAVKDALSTMRPANLFLGKSEVVIGYNRNLPGSDQPYDTGLDVLRVDYQHEEKDDVVFLVGCHPVFENSGREGVTISPNYPGVARELLRDHDQVRTAMFMQGCGGDINPIDSDHRLTAKKVADAVSEMLDDGHQHQLTGGISYYLDTLAFDSRPWPEEKIRGFQAVNEGKEGDVSAEKNVRWADLMLAHIEQGTMPEYMPVLIQTFNVGQWKLIGLSRETTTEYSLGIKAIWPGKLVTVAGYCNDVSSYLPTRRHIQAGIYEGYESFFWYGQPNVFPENVYETIIEFVKTKSH